MNCISVIVLTRNSENHIEKCLHSIYKQNYPNFEVIIVDADSKDRTLKIVLNIEKSYNAVGKTRIICVDKDTTIGGARQIGFEQSTGDIIAWIDSDVELPHENWLENMVKPIINFIPCECVAGTQTLSKNRPDDPCILKHLHNSFEYKNTVIDIDNYEIVGTGHCLIKRKCIEEVGGFRDIMSHEDIDLTKKIMQKGYKFVYLKEEKVYHYHVDSFCHYIKKHIIRNKLFALRRILYER